MQTRILLLLSLFHLFLIEQVGMSKNKQWFNYFFLFTLQKIQRFFLIAKMTLVHVAHYLVLRKPFTRSCPRN